MTLVRHDIRPSSIVTRAAIENAIAGGRRDRRLDERASSTSWPSPTRWTCRSTIDDFDTIAARTPIVADMTPGRPLHGRPTCTTPAASRWSCASCSSATCSHGEREERRRPDAGEDRRGGRGDRRARRSSARSTTPLKPTGGLAILHGSLAPEGCVVKLAGHERLAPPRAGARLRLGDGLLRGGQEPPDPAPATSS